MKNLLEAYVDSVESAYAAYQGGANRLALCGGLAFGGITPDINLFYEIRNHIDIPIHVLIRPRFGDFCYDKNEFDIMKNDIAMFCDAGAEGVSVGILNPDGTFDVPRMDELMTYMNGMHVTLNRAFDFCCNPMETMDQAKMIGIHAILTSGQQTNCYEGRSLIAQMVLRADGMEVIACGGINSKNIEPLVRVTGAHSFGMSGKKERESAMRYRKPGVSTGIPFKKDYTIWYTDVNEIARVRAILDEYENKSPIL